MSVLQVWKAGTVMFIKRSLPSGYPGTDNPLFYRDSTMMLFGDAKKVTESIVKAMQPCKSGVLGLCPAGGCSITGGLAEALP